MVPKILVLDGNQRASLAAVRSLGAQGLWIAVGECSAKSLAGASRFCSCNVSYTDPYQSPRGFFEDIVQQIESLGITFILPITEASSYALLHYSAELPENVTLPFADAHAIEQLANKNNLFRLAESLAIPIPTTIYCNNQKDGLETLNQTLKFPVVLKPFKSRILLDDSIMGSHVKVAQTRTEAVKAIEQEAFFDFPFTIQEFVEGHGRGVFALYNHGQPVCFFAHRRLREKPPAGGVSVLCESVPVDPVLKDRAERLLTAANWHGVAMVEFRVSDDGQSYLMEINTRFWGSLQLAVDAGVDFPYWLYCATMDLPFNPIIEPRPTRLRWLLGDLDRLYLVLKAPMREYSFWQKFKEVLQFLKPNRRTRHEVNRIGDLRPFFFELKQYLKAIFWR